jgi:hypothetical protein
MEKQSYDELVHRFCDLQEAYASITKELEYTYDRISLALVAFEKEKFETARRLLDETVN